MLRHHRLTRHVTVPISAGLRHDIAGYRDSLAAYRSGDPEPILERLVEATFRAIPQRAPAGDRHRQLRDSWRRTISARRDSAVWPVVDRFLARPVLDASEIGRQLGIRPTNVPRTLKQLVDLGVVWRAGRVLQALDEFSARAGRRTGV